MIEFFYFALHFFPLRSHAVVSFLEVISLRSFYIIIIIIASCLPLLLIIFIFGTKSSICYYIYNYVTMICKPDLVNLLSNHNLRLVSPVPRREGSIFAHFEFSIFIHNRVAPFLRWSSLRCRQSFYFYLVLFCSTLPYSIFFSFLFFNSIFFILQKFLAYETRTNMKILQI